MLNILSLGAGRQSSYLFHASGRGILPKLDCAIFADTGWEPDEVYGHLQWLIDEWSPEYGIPIHVVGTKNIKDDALVSQVRGVKTEGRRWVSMPLRTKAVWNEGNAGLLDMEIEKLKSEGKSTSRLESVLARVKAGEEVVQDGMITRQCTSEYKIQEIEKFIKTEILGLEINARWPKHQVARKWFGISQDEWTRMRAPKLNRKEKVEVGNDLFGEPVIEERSVERIIRWHSNVYYLCDTEWYADGDKCRRRDLGTWPMTAQDCINWHLENGLPAPPESACKGCPYRSNESWRKLRDESPEEWEEVCEFDDQIRNCGGMRGEVFLHKQLVPLRLANIDEEDEDGGLFPCDGGVCGV
tara:strand:- start:899 stop:1963 length:1065 start_codon:yes stop_codon:yes gene_type:complete